MKTTENRGYPMMEMSDQPDFTVYGGGFNKMDADVVDIYRQKDNKAAVCRLSLAHNINLV